MEHNPEYMDLQTLWNDRRDPHASPLSSSPRRMYARAGKSSLGDTINSIYRPSVGDTNYEQSDERLYSSTKEKA